MMETLCLRNEPKRYIVSIRKKVLIVTHDYFVAKRIEEDIVKRNITDENFSVVIGTGRQK
jgi:hypothetical protein